MSVPKRAVGSDHATIGHNLRQLQALVGRLIEDFSLAKTAHERDRTGTAIAVHVDGGPTDLAAHVTEAFDVLLPHAEHLDKIRPHLLRMVQQ